MHSIVIHNLTIKTLKLQLKHVSIMHFVDVLCEQ